MQRACLLAWCFSAAGCCFCVRRESQGRGTTAAISAAHLTPNNPTPTPNHTTHTRTQRKKAAEEAEAAAAAARKRKEEAERRVLVSTITLEQAHDAVYKTQPMVMVSVDLPPIVLVFVPVYARICDGCDERGSGAGSVCSRELLGWEAERRFSPLAAFAHAPASRHTRHNHPTEIITQSLTQSSPNRRWASATASPTTAPPPGAPGRRRRGR